MVNVSFGKQQKMYRLMGSNEKLSKRTELTKDNQFVVLACNGVLRILTVDEMLKADDSTMKQYFDEDQMAVD